MNTPQVVVVNTGAANLASVAAALSRLGTQAHVSEDTNCVKEARLLVLPGVGAFGPAMRRLRERKLDDALLDRVRLGRPLLAICLGMQLLCEQSEESPGEQGLGIIPGSLRRFESPARVPQMGWNQITPAPGAVLLQPAAMYFANSYRLDTIPNGWSGTTSLYGNTFASALERGPILACQFHPELSGNRGLELISRWLALSPDTTFAPTSEASTC